MSNGEVKPVPQEDIEAFERAAKRAEADEGDTAPSETKPLELDTSEAAKNAVRRIIDNLKGR